LARNDRHDAGQRREACVCGLFADRAYTQAIGILGPTTEILYNQGYSYMLRGDYKRAREKLAEAERKDPGNKYVLNNIQLLEDSYRNGKSIQ